MKQIAILAFIILIIGGGYFFFFKDGAKKEVALVTPSAEVKEQPIILFKESGFVTYKKKGDTEYVRVTADETEIPNESYVKTVEGRGYVVLPDNSSISLENNTEILISYSKEKTSIFQLLGATYHRVQALATGSTYEVRTPSTLASVRGTKFAVVYDAKKRKTKISVTEHKVDVAPIKDLMATTTEQVESVLEGKTATVEVQAPSSSQPEHLVLRTEDTDKVPEQKALVDENKVIDKVIDSHTEKREFIREFMKQIKEEEVAPPVKTTKPETKTPTEKRKVIIEKALEETVQEIKNDKKDVVVPQEEKAPTKNPATTTKEIIIKPVTETKLTTATPIQTTASTTPVNTLKNVNTLVENMSDEDSAFVDAFYTEYEKYLYVDASFTVCQRAANVTPATIVASLESFANKKGYNLPKKEGILSLATDLVSACKDDSVRTKMQVLQTKFDVVYPFN